MAIPSTAVIWAETLDPSDYLDFSIDCSPLLETTESISSYTVLPGPEGSLLGLTVSNDSRVNKVIQFWLAVDLAHASDPAFTTGSNLPVEVTIITSTGRKWQRTAVIKVAQR